MRRFAFRLALALGMTVRDLLQKIGSDELSEWMAFYELEPFGEFRADFRGGLIAATFANVHRSPHTRPFAPDDFMPFIKRQSPPDPSQQNIRQFKAMFAHKLKKHG